LLLLLLLLAIVLLLAAMVLLLVWVRWAAAAMSGTAVLAAVRCRWALQYKSAVQQRCVASLQERLAAAEARPWKPRPQKHCKSLSPQEKSRAPCMHRLMR
jgi:hypothetical protein